MNQQMKCLATQVAVLLTALCGLLAEEKDTPDAAAHTVIVPYDIKTKPDLKKASRFYLDYTEFERLWKAAKENRMPPPVVDDTIRPEAFINSALYDARVEPDQLVVSARLMVVTRGTWSRLSLAAAPPPPMKNPQNADLGDGVRLESRIVQPDPGTKLPGEILVDGSPLALVNGEVLIENPGPHLVEWNFTVPAGKAWTQAELALPPAASGMLRVSTPLSEGPPSLSFPIHTFEYTPGGGASASTSAPLAPLVTEETLPDVHVVAVPLERDPTVVIFREPRRKKMGDTLPAVTDTYIRMVEESGLETFFANVRFQFPGVQRNMVTLRLDPAIRVSSWKIPHLKEVRMRKEGDNLFADVTFTRAINEGVLIELSASRGFSDPIGNRTTPVIEGVAVKNTSSIQLAVSGELKIVPQLSSRVQQVKDPMTPPAGRVSMGTYKVPPGQQLTYAVLPADDRSMVTAESVYQLSAQKAEIISAITFDTGRGPLLDAKIGVPSGFEVQTLAGPKVKSWHREGGEVLIRFNDQPERPARVVLHVAKSAATPVSDWKLEPLTFPGFKKRQETVLIAAHAADDVQLTFDATDRKMQETDPAGIHGVVGVTAPLEMKRALKVEKSDWTAQATITRQAAKFSVDAILLAQATDEGLAVSQQVGVAVEQGAVGTVTVRLPGGLPEARVRGPLVKDAQSKVNGAFREYEVSFQEEVLGRADFALEYDLPLDGEKTLPVVTVDGATRLRRFAIVDNAGSREMKVIDGGATVASRESLPYLPQDLHRPQYYLAGDQAALKLSFTQLESTGGNAAIITLAEITSALRPNGERWDTVVYSLSNRSLQFLPVRLPDGASLIDVSVGGQPVRADKASADAGKAAVFLIPLIQMRPGELSQEVRLVYKVAAGRDTLVGRQILDDPELVGLSAERTLWNVWVPEHHELKGWDGNMESIVEEVQELEQQESLISDLSRLNGLLSSNTLSSSDSEVAWGNAGVVLEKLRGYQQSKGSSSRSVYGSGGQGDESSVAQVTKSMNDVQSKISQQGLLLEANKDKVEEARHKRNNDDAFYRLANQSQIWLENSSNPAADPFGKPAPAAASAQAVNDNITLDGTFLAKVEMDPIMSEEIRAKTAQEAKEAGNLGFNNGRALQQLQMDNAPADPPRTTVDNFVEMPAIQNEALAKKKQAPSDSSFAGATRVPRPARRSGIGMDITLPAAPMPAPSVQLGANRLELKPLDKTLGENQSTPQLKPVGRVSLSVEVPLEGTVHHFRKIKDHAVVELKIVKPWEPSQKGAFWALVAGGIILLAIGLRRRERVAPSPDLKASPIAP